jgi:predicted nucleic acid-binding protein
VTDLVVADHSVFIEYLRGDSDDALGILILKNRVLLSPIVRLELLAGVKKTELKTIERLCNALRQIEDFAAPLECERLLARARGSGLFGGIPDLLVIADAARYRAALFSYDRKMMKLASKLGIELIKA